MNRILSIKIIKRLKYAIDYANIIFKTLNTTISLNKSFINRT
jgi:hypothetical protein